MTKRRLLKKIVAGLLLLPLAPFMLLIWAVDVWYGEDR